MRVLNYVILAVWGTFKITQIAILVPERIFYMKFFIYAVLPVVGWLRLLLSILTKQLHGVLW